uniref:protein CutA homolog n=1 Tax=Oncorhynchus gorbuscha TaxID=8017 RepID=UPI001EAEC011|nr:protein CutA homolog [Oncorhynchus gorbuscha]
MRFGLPATEGLQAGGPLRAFFVIALLSVLMLTLLRTVGLRAFSMASETYMSGTHSAAFVTCPNEQVAKDLARAKLSQVGLNWLHIHQGCLNRAGKDPVKIKHQSRGIAEKKLAACVNIVPKLHLYEWQGKIQEDSEVLLMIKTRSSKVASLAEYVRSNHP